MVQQNSHDSIATMDTVSVAMKSRTTWRPSSFGCGSGCGKAVVAGTESKYAFSSAVISAGTSSKSGVERYRSPVSGSITTMLLPAGSSFAFRSATASTPPPLVPEKMPSDRASSCEAATASAPDTCESSSYKPCSVESSTIFGTKSGVQPCSRCGRKTGCDSFVMEPSVVYSVLMPLYTTGALDGSQSSTFVCGDLSLSTCPTPLIVPPVPYAHTNQSSFSPSIACRISGPVVCRCTHAFASFSNWFGQYQPCFSLRARSVCSMPPNLCAGLVRTTLAPRNRIILRRSIEKASDMTQTKG
mmetsp:Transcript_3235/g.9485  ORF Transcript_3235/g.9485 Transcript_3235/m.9485 type:complete len:300 (-) Transcript_3235:369-1268(-)